MQFARALVAEFIGTAFLLLVVVGSGILAHSLDQGNVALSVLCVALSTGAVLTALILTFGGISAHFNPVVTVASALRKEFAWQSVLPYILAQVLGACAGVILSNLMFDLPAVTISSTARHGTGLWLGEVIATFGLLGVIWGCGKNRPEAVPYAVAAFVTGAIYFTSSTCFANPAVTIARTLTATLTGIAPGDVLAFIAAQTVGAGLALTVFNWLFQSPQQAPPDEVVDLNKMRRRLEDSLDMNNFPQ